MVGSVPAGRGVSISILLLVHLVNYEILETFVGRDRRGNSFQGWADSRQKPVEFSGWCSGAQIRCIKPRAELLVLFANTDNWATPQPFLKQKSEGWVQEVVH